MKEIKQFSTLTPLLLALVVSACQTTKVKTVNPDDLHGWTRSKDSYDTTKFAILKKKIQDSTFRHINSIIVIKNGELLIEEYFNGATRSRLHDTRSVTKTLTATMLGVAIQEGHIQNIEQPLSDFYDLKKYANYDPVKGQIKLRDLVTMSSNFDGDDSDEQSLGNEENMYPTKNWVDFTLNLPLAKTRTSGQEWHYFTAGVVVLGDILNKKLPQGLESYTFDKLFTPLSINAFKWQYTPQKVVNTAGGLALTPLDLAKLGQLYRNKGIWKNQQIIPESWASTSMSRQKNIPFDGMAYGYLLWNRALKSNGKEYNTFNFLGNGGNRIVIMPDEAFTIVITASAYNTDYGHKQVDKMLTEYILPAIDEKK
jgi:CubicO group peptidase (beta-lactamase class C family)